MSSGAKLLCFLLLIPFFLAMGFDIYVNSGAQGGTIPNIESIDLANFQSSDLGYILVTYQPDLYDIAKLSISEQAWAKWVDPILRMNTYVVALAPLGLFCIWILIAKVLGIWPFEPHLPKVGSKSVRDDRGLSKQKFKYKRR